MLLKSIKLKNFRQFIDTEIHFSTDKKKNVTFIMANNRTGKTTLASAFTWCLFGDAGLSDGILLNRIVKNELNTRQEVDVEVEVRLQYGNNDYNVKRIQTYRAKDLLYGKRVVESINTKLFISYMNEDGETIGVAPDKVQDTLNLIIPRDLAGYLFMKSEEINAMGKNVQKKLTEGDFSAAIKKILGLQAIENAVKHLTGQQNSVYSLFQKDFNGNSNAQIEKLQAKLDEIKSQIERNENYIKTAEKDIELLTNRNQELTEEIVKWEDGARQQAELSKLEERIKSQQASLENAKKQYLSSFASDLPVYLLQHIVPDVLSVLKETKIEDKNVPNVNNKTIEYLLKRGECICGCHLDIGSEAHSTLVKLLDYVPPKYIGATVSEFITEAKTHIDINRMPNIPMKFKQFKTLLLTLQGNIDDNYEKIEDLRKHLKEHKDTREYEIERSNNIESIKSKNSSIISRKTANVELDAQYKSKEKELLKVSQEDAANKKVSECIGHVRYISSVLKQHLVEKESELRNMMVEKMNEIFTSVFSSTYKINLNEAYKLSMTDSDGEPIDFSGAQSVFVYLAFITSVLYLAQQIHYKRIKNKAEDNFLITEPYPLVLDAPFSAFDKINTTKACNRLPELTEQIIIFSKDLEGILVKEQLKDRIGKYYTMAPVSIDGNEDTVLETRVEEGDINADSI